MAGHAMPQAPRLAAAWEGPQGVQVGLLVRAAAGWRVAAAIDVPTRAHGIVVEPEGTLLAVARRPGDWMLRWNAAGRTLAWVWNDPARRFNGHARRRGALLYTTETDVETGEGCVVVRDARSLAVHALWSSGGIDPHDLCFAPDGTLWVANGGIATQLETGRAKLNLDRMDSSLVHLDASGRQLGQWRLDDPRLSLRHLALCDEQLGMALQAEHDDPARRAEAPVIAIFDGRRLRTGEARPLAGYGGDIVATETGYAVSVPRAGGLAMFADDGRWLGHVELEQACALASRGPALFAGGSKAALTLRAGRNEAMPMPAMRLDNHWQLAA
jgi:hypothetical protein